MASLKPYLLRAVFEWCVEDGYTPYVTAAAVTGVRVPQAAVRDGLITLNLSADAVHQFQMNDEQITFDARFSGKAFPVCIPVDAVVALFARENGEGLHFEPTLPADETEDEHLPADEASGAAPAASKRTRTKTSGKRPPSSVAPHLKIVK
jgi:stringent starvation protein B